MATRFTAQRPAAALGAPGTCGRAGREVGRGPARAAAGRPSPSASALPRPTPPTHRSPSSWAASAGPEPALPRRPVPGRVPAARPPGSAERGSEISPRISARIGPRRTPPPNGSASLPDVTDHRANPRASAGGGATGPERTDLRPGGARVRGSRGQGGQGALPGSWRGAQFRGLAGPRCGTRKPGPPALRPRGTRVGGGSAAECGRPDAGIK